MATMMAAAAAVLAVADETAEPTTSVRASTVAPKLAHRPSTPPLSNWEEGDAREALARYESLVRYEASRFRAAALRTNAIDEDDLCVEGRIAVLEALRRFGGWGTSETSWVRTRVRQRMIDVVRRSSILSRSESSLVAASNKRPGNEVEANESTRMAAQRRLVSIDAENDNERSLGDTLSDTQLAATDDMVDRCRRVARLDAAITGLKPRARLVIERIFVDGASSRDVAAELGVTESRISQIVHAAVPELRAVVAPSMFPPPAPTKKSARAAKADVAPGELAH